MSHSNESICPCRRRRFLTLLGVGAAVAATAAMTGCGDGVELEVLMEDVEIDLSLYPDLDVVGQTVLVAVDELALPIAITRTEYEDEPFFVTGTECSHNGCGVNRSGAGWKCPCHGARFDLDGRLRKGPADQPLVAYEYVLDGDRMTVLGQG